MSSIYALDDSTILNNFVLEIPKGFQDKFDGKERIIPDNKDKIDTFLSKLKDKGITPLRFSSGENMPIEYDFEKRIKKIINRWLKPYGLTFEGFNGGISIDILLQMQDFFIDIEDKFTSIIKSKEISPIKRFFEKNKKELKTKLNNIPEDEDCEIILTYYNYKTEKDKYLISADAHFWGYKDEIKKEFNINVVEEWLCDTLTIK